ncbi:amino acid deaminase/aldolase [Cytobacillus purgationiresistens]|uniref:amino acid deaminase/aldolase n=1 Tax=Cytobacillus purgationiresistens TaxID=863449 RepID=UPI003521BE79
MSKDMIKNEKCPNLFLDLDALDKNCQEIANKSRGKTIRIATKSIRSVKVLRRILQSHPIYKGVMSFTSTEALFLIEKGFDDILIGYPSWDEKALSRISLIKEEQAKVICMVDSIEQVEYLNHIAHNSDGTLNICIDIDMSTNIAGFHFGVRRSPLTRSEQVLALVNKVMGYPHLQFKGVMGYEAQIAGVGDNAPSSHIKNKMITLMKKKSIVEVKARRSDILAVLKAQGLIPDLVNGGGTGSLKTTAMEDGITEITVGSGFYSPLLFDSYRDLQYEPALYFALPIVRKPGPHLYTCLGGGYVASGTPGIDKLPLPVIPAGAKLLPMEGAGEVQTPIFYDKDFLHLGDPVIFRPAKAGEICERFPEILCFSNGELVDRFETYRGDGVCFL